MASDPEIIEFNKHCYAALFDSKRKLEYSFYGGKTQALAAANSFLVQGKKLIADFQAFGRQPQERHDWIIEKFSCDAVKKGRSLALQKSCLISRLVSQGVHWLEADMMQAAIRATPGLSKKDTISLKFVQEGEQFRAQVDATNESITKQFAKITDARNWLLSMGKSSEAGVEI